MAKSINRLAITIIRAFFFAISNVAFEALCAGSSDVGAARLSELAAHRCVVLFAGDVVGEDQEEGDQDR